MSLLMVWLFLYSNLKQKLNVSFYLAKSEKWYHNIVNDLSWVMDESMLGCVASDDRDSVYKDTA